MEVPDTARLALEATAGGFCEAPLPADAPPSPVCGRLATRTVLVACPHVAETVRVCEMCFAGMAADAGVHVGPDGRTCRVLITDLTMLREVPGG